MKNQLSRVVDALPVLIWTALPLMGTSTSSIVRTGRHSQPTTTQIKASDVPFLSKSSTFRLAKGSPVSSPSVNHGCERPELQ